MSGFFLWIVTPIRHLRRSLSEKLPEDLAGQDLIGRIERAHEGRAAKGAGFAVRVGLSQGSLPKAVAGEPAAAASDGASSRQTHSVDGASAAPLEGRVARPLMRLAFPASPGAIEVAFDNPVLRAAFVIEDPGSETLEPAFGPDHASPDLRGGAGALRSDRSFGSVWGRPSDARILIGLDCEAPMRRIRKERD